MGKLDHHIEAERELKAECDKYGDSKFAGTLNRCVCMNMGDTPAANTMRDGLLAEFLATGHDSFGDHLYWIRATWNMKGGNWPLISLILRNGMECPGTTHDILESIGFNQTVEY